MRIIRLLSWVGLFAVLSLTACERSFDAPPASVLVGSFDPPRGFLDTVLVIYGEQFEPVAEDNIVFFGTESAAILSVNEAGTELRVRVPELPIDSLVSIKVSTATGQASSEDLFAYRGPGHPLLEELSRGFELDSGPVALQARVDHLGFGETSVPVYEVLVANAAARTITKVNLLSGHRKVMGLHDIPGTLAACETDLGVDIYFSHLSEENGITQGSVSSISFRSQDADIMQDGAGDYFEGMDEDNQEEILGNWENSPNNSDQQAFQPGLIQVIQEAQADGVGDAKLVAADRYRKLIMVADPSVLGSSGDGSMNFCAFDFSVCGDAGPSAVADMMPTAPAASRWNPPPSRY
ncbi:MAG: IPT/TIG domain-containing protein [Deltaproteobacteria bacterium]|nr:IPT/TIG domain-containing protein [Deltaproteobacteria bacterium]